MSRHDARADGVDEPTAAPDDQPAGDGPDGTDGAGATPPARRRVALVVGAGLVAAAVVAAVAVVVVRGTGSAEADPVAATVPVALSARVPDGTALGVVVTLGEGEGSEWAGAAQGARVAQERFALGGADVSLVTEDDGGTEDGARAAVEALVDQGVAGIVVASSGGHVAGALDAAAASGVPVLLPYADLPADAAAAAGSAWSLAPDADGAAAAMSAALDGTTRPLVLDAGGGVPDGVPVGDVLTVEAQADPAALETELVRRAGLAPPAEEGEEAPVPVEAPIDAVLVSGPPARQAALVEVLQAADLPVPVVLTPGATSPAFSAALAEAGGSASGGFVTVGTETDDAVALRSDAAGRSMSAFLAGVRVAATDGDVQNLTDDQPFSAVAQEADSRGHDAVVALVRAVAEAGSTAPAEVATALEGLTPGAAQGIAGPALDFGSDHAATTGAVVLHASPQSLGLRPAGAEGAGRLTWFADAQDD